MRSATWRRWPTPVAWRSNVTGVPDALLTPSETWADRDAYATQAQKLQEMFARNFEKYADDVSDAVRESGPQPVAAR